MAEQLVDPAVSKAKFERELADYRQFQDDYIAKGWFLVKAEFPRVFVVFAAPRSKPISLAFGALIDFTNYDLWPLSVKLADPLTQAPFKFGALPTPLPRNVAPAPGPGEPTGPNVVVRQDLMQAYGPEEIPFVCVPGVREYHENPAHTGDSWLSHRAKGEGTLAHILNVLYQYGAMPLLTRIQVQIALAPNEIPR